MTSHVATYRCTACGLHYTEKSWAEACQRHCTTHQACSIAITAHSVERQARSTNRPG